MWLKHSRLGALGDKFSDATMMLGFHPMKLWSCCGLLAVLHSSSWAQTLPDITVRWGPSIIRAAAGSTGGQFNKSADLLLGKVTVTCVKTCLVHAISTVQYVAPQTSFPLSICITYDGVTSPVCGNDAPLPTGYSYPHRTVMDMASLPAGRHVLQTRLRSEGDEFLRVLRWRTVYQVSEAI